MRFPTLSTIALAALVSALPSEHHLARRDISHARIARSVSERAPEPLPVAEPLLVPVASEKKARDPSKRCKKKHNPNAAGSSSSSNSATSSSTSSSAASTPTDSGNSGNNGDSGNNNNNNGNSGNSGNSGSGGSPSTSGLTTAPSYCGGPSADSNSPNGQEWYLNCGMTGGGWAPPFVTLDQLVTVPLQDAINSGSGVFDPCSPYVDTFQQVSQATGVPDIFLAAFAMQESTCNPGAVGPNGEQGLMQLTVDKCGGAPGGNCQDVYFNINTGANYIQSTISAAGGNVVQMVGMYNGYTLGQTIASVIANPNCGAQQNLDYLNEFFNYWIVNRDAGQSGAAQYNNQQLCSAGLSWQISTS
ncbi:lysozyme-like protein [Dacryopinax primogenitus]|uniref:Lysozyme-like protein n=1 Tax=Dacryopinax primogenitus (strain DJM 731) TaxID=1858805 RepID=M5G3S5_DACPD|nr:lysozyme-like protein [Dacryopinax primogenitus]EJU00502.1 lysozyme-like protein [Dacryopinax primogenitus]